jgi:ABC-type nitrate/sulfonate/bicarbonate transport system permease component
MNAHRSEALLPAVGVVGLLAVWSLVTWRQWVDPVLLPSPLATFESLWRGMDGGPLGFDFVKTVYRTAASTLIAAVIAIPLGIVLGSAEKLYRSLEFVIDFFRSTPASAMFPLFLVLFGVGDETKIAVAAFGAALVILFNVAYGVMNARKTRLLAAKVMGASELRILFDVMLLESLPQTFVGLRNGVSLALVIMWWRKCSSARRTGSATACSRRSNCSTCRACMRRFSPPARWAMDSTFCSCS